jgi:Replication initiator protein, pSAM2
VRLVGSTRRISKATGAVVSVYSSGQELDGITYLRCGNRRASRCESCSSEYKGDAWHLLSAGLTGGKGAPETVRAHPTTFVTLTPPSFGPVHGLRRGATCRPRHNRPVCPHGRALWCLRRHQPGDDCLGEPLCAECYDYVGHVLWQWHAPELWRRFKISLERTLGHLAGVSRDEFPDLVKVAHVKVVEFQARGLIHVHAVMRLDGPEGPGSPLGLDVDALVLGEAIGQAAAAVRLEVRPEGHQPVALRWGDQIDTRPITLGAGRDDQVGDVHPEMMAAYLAKYLTKSTEDFGLDGHGKVHSSTDARYLGASRHAVRIIETAEQLATGAGEDYERLADRYGTLGYRGHVLTKTRRYPTTFRGAAPGPVRVAAGGWSTGPGSGRGAGARGPRRPRRRPGRDHHRAELAVRRGRVLRRRHRRSGPGLSCARSGAPGPARLTDRSHLASFRSWAPITDGWNRWVKGRRGEEVRPQGAGSLGLAWTSSPCP